MTTKFWALIAAAGKGSRMNSQIAKQYLLLRGKPVIDYSLELFCRQTKISAVMVVNNGSNSPSMPNVYVCQGAQTRTGSVLNGLLAIEQLDDSNPVVLIHDAARPCLAEQDLQNCLNILAAQPDQPLILARKSTDSVKTAVNRRGKDYIDKSLNRETVWLATTPQCARLQTIKQAIESATEKSTDEAGYLEQAGHHIRILQASNQNIKITTADDLPLAEALVKT